MDIDLDVNQFVLNIWLLQASSTIFGSIYQSIAENVSEHDAAILIFKLIYAFSWMECRHGWSDSIAIDNAIALISVECIFKTKQFKWRFILWHFHQLRAEFELFCMEFGMEWRKLNFNLSSNVRNTKWLHIAMQKRTSSHST